MLSTTAESDLSVTRAISILEHALALCGVTDCQYDVQHAVITVDDSAAESGEELTETEFINRVADKLADELTIQRDNLAKALPSKYVLDTDTEATETSDAIEKFLDDCGGDSGDIKPYTGEAYWGVDRGSDITMDSAPATRTATLKKFDPENNFDKQPSSCTTSLSEP